MRPSIDIIKELTFLREKKEDITQREQEVSKPILTELKQIQIIYDWFYSLPKEYLLTDQDSVHKRQFLFIIILLFSPTFFVGDKLKRGLRNELARVLHFRSPSAISNLSSDVLCWYKSYQGFREKTNRIYEKLLCEL